MSKQITIPQGEYTVGVDFPNGSYVFDSLKQSFPLFLYVNNHRLNDWHVIPSSSEIEHKVP